MSNRSQGKAGTASFLNDFKNLNPNDPGAWPLAPRIAVLFLVFVLVLGAGWYVFCRDEIDILDGKRAEEVKFKETYLEKKKMAVNLDLYKQQLNEIDSSFGALLKQLPSKAEVASLLVEISQAGLGRGLQSELFQPGQEVVRDFYAELPITVKLSGTYHDLGAFASDIGGLSRIVTLNNIVIASNKQVPDGPLSMDAVVKTFRYLDEEEVAARKRAEKAAKGGGK